MTEGSGDVAGRIAKRIESWLRPGIGRHYVAEAIIKDLERNGLMIVPLEPTPEMLRAMTGNGWADFGIDSAAEIWRAALAMRPR